MIFKREMLGVITSVMLLSQWSQPLVASAHDSKTQKVGINQHQSSEHRRSSQTSKKRAQPERPPEITQDHSLQGMLVPLMFIINVQALYEYRVTEHFRLKARYNQWVLLSDRLALGSLGVGYSLVELNTDEASHALEVTLGLGYSSLANYCGGAQGGWTCNQRSGVTAHSTMGYRYQSYGGFILKVGADALMTLEGDYMITPDLLVGVAF